MPDDEKNRFSARAARYARVGANVGGVAARIAGARLFGIKLDRGRSAVELAAALGGLKGPIMKVAQLMATIPDALPPEYAAELAKLQSQAPPMGWAFVKRRMTAELGPDWQEKLKDCELIRVPRPWPKLSTGRLLTLDWLEGRRLLEHKHDALAVRNRLATALFTAWWFPFSRYGVIHGDPHLGNYTVFEDADRSG